MSKNFQIATPADLEEILQDISAAEYVAYDIETTGLNPRKDRIIGAAFAPSIGKAWYIPTLTWDRPHESLRPAFEGLFLDVLYSLPGKKLLMHNGSFDIRFTYENYGIDLSRHLYADTMLLKHTLDEERPFGLKDIAKKIQAHIGLDVSEEANKEQLELKEHLKSVGASQTRECYELFKGDTEIIGKYANADVDLTFRVFEYYGKLLKEQNLEEFFYKDEVMPLYREVTIPMEMNGIPFDVEKCETLKAEIAEDLNVLEQKILIDIDPLLDDFKTWFLNKDFPPKRSGGFAQAAVEHFGVELPMTKKGNYSASAKNVEKLPDSVFKAWMMGEQRLDASDIRAIQEIMNGDAPMFNIYSKDHLKRVFFKKLGLTPSSTTDLGNPQVNDDFLHKVKGDLPWVKDLLLYNRLTKLKTAYYDRYAKTQENGMVYPSFQQHRTISGRYGSDLQQLPRPVKTAHPMIMKYQNPIRELFISGEGFVFCDADYVSLEPHVFAHVSGDENLLNIFRSGDDFYSTVVQRTLGLTEYSANPDAPNYLGKLRPELRQQGKAYALGIPYGMSAYKLKFEIDCSEFEAKKIVKDYLAAFPDLAKWMKESERQCLELGEVRSQAGRVRHMPEAPKILAKYGKSILHDLELWKEFHEKPRTYAEAKLARKKLKGLLNNSKNYQIQSLSASIVNRAAIAINRYLWEQEIPGHVVAQVHDQLIVRVGEKYKEQVRVKMQELMENTYKISLDLRAPVDLGYNFRDAH